MFSRRAFLGLAASQAALALVARHAFAFPAGAGAPTMTVYKSPTCGCCTKWVEHVQKNGIAVVAKDVDDVTSLKRDLGVPVALWSCHTGVIEGYAIEGHVPATEIRRLLKERPKLAGVAVPGMPAGSPGMESPRPDHYDVIAFDTKGRTRVFARR
jgi:hypothetical protein